MFYELKKKIKIILQIIDRDGNPLGPNQKGEVVVKTKFSFLGYSGNPEKTDEVLTKDGWFSTGNYA